MSGKKETVNWNSVETWKRLVASMVAVDSKYDLRQIAACYGTTYDTLQNRFRTIKDEAKALKAEVESGGRGANTPSVTPRKPKAPKTPKSDGVLGGRVTKRTPKSKNQPVIKQEVVGGSSSENKSEDEEIYEI